MDFHKFVYLKNMLRLNSVYMLNLRNRVVSGTGSDYGQSLRKVSVRIGSFLQYDIMPHV